MRRQHGEVQELDDKELIALSKTKGGGVQGIPKTRMSSSLGHYRSKFDA